MSRWSTIAVGALLMAVVAMLVTKGGRRSLVAEGAKTDARRENPHEERLLPEGGILDDPIFAADFDAAPRAGSTIAAADAEALSALPNGSPKMIRFGVILVQYRGAQQAPASSRPKEEALALAKSIAEAARTDFKAQVSRGDPGSMEDAGRIPRGVLEPAAEYALFTLNRGDVSDPVETPRGFWIVKRID